MDAVDQKGSYIAISYDSSYIVRSKAIPSSTAELLAKVGNGHRLTWDEQQAFVWDQCAPHAMEDFYFEHSASATADDDEKVDTPFVGHRIVKHVSTDKSLSRYEPHIKTTSLITCLFNFALCKLTGHAGCVCHPGLEAHVFWAMVLGDPRGKARRRDVVGCDG